MRSRAAPFYSATRPENREMKIIGLVPVRNEAWILPHSLASLSGFCDVVIVSDQNSDDRSREICRTLSKSRAARVVRMPDQHAGAMAASGCGARLRRPQPSVVHGRGRTGRAARGRGLLHRAARRAEAGHRHRMHCSCISGTAPTGTASTDWRYGPHLKPLALVDDRHAGLRPVAPCSRSTSHGSRLTARAERPCPRCARPAPAMAARRAHPDAPGVVPVSRMARRKARRPPSTKTIRAPCQTPALEPRHCLRRGPRGSLAGPGHRP